MIDYCSYMVLQFYSALFCSSFIMQYGESATEIMLHLKMNRLSNWEKNVIHIFSLYLSFVDTRTNLIPSNSLLTLV